MICSKIIGDSINPVETRLTSVIFKYPRWMHSELMTHRVFSRNAASSRAIPFERMVRDLRYDPACPVYWGTEQRGMQPAQEVNAPNSCREMWLLARDRMIDDAECIRRVFNLHKGTLNRIIEPWAWMTVLVTGSQWGFSNFFSLRAHKDAMPEFQALAYPFLEQYLDHKPAQLDWGQWHIPEFGEMESLHEVAMLQVATARCARLSYLTFDGKHDISADKDIHKKLMTSGHWSPFEHCAQAIDDQHYGAFTEYPWSNFDMYSEDGWPGGTYWDRNLKPSCWGQYRKLFKDENRPAADLNAILATKPDWIK